jgi:hypothetical protein
MKHQPTNDPNPPRWLECILLLVLKRRDRESISGDLLEEYREVILPARGPWRANWWYFKQALSLVSNAKWGFALGATLGVFNLSSTFLFPLAEDTPFAVMSFFSAVLILWSLSGFAAERRTGCLLEAMKAGATVGVVSMGVFHVGVILRLNLFLNTISQREDWQGLLTRFGQSQFETLRGYANWEYLQATSIILLLGVVAGAACGVAGGIIAVVGAVRPNSHAIRDC